MRLPPVTIRHSAPATHHSRSERPKDTLGRVGEAMALRHLRDDGFTILDRNWRCTMGEIDIVARDGDTLVICEVKTRSSLRYGTPLEAITETKLHRLERLAASWMRERGVRANRVRIDAICVHRPPRGQISIEHIRDLT